MSRVTIPAKDQSYEAWIDNFKTVALANATALGLTTGQTAALTALVTAFKTALTDSTVAKFAAKSKVAGKDDARFASEQLIRSYAKVINADGNISNELKASLGITITPTTSGTVKIPTGLAVVSIVEGVNTLTWNGNGNVQGTTYIIETKLPSELNWTFLDTSTAKRFDHTGQIPGQQVSYRVSAKRAGKQSVYSMAVTSYVATEPETLTLHEAA